MENLCGQTARYKWKDGTLPYCDLRILDELEEAAIPLQEKDLTKNEVPASYIGVFHGWEFTRQWVYWSADNINGEPIPVERAKTLNSLLGRSVRVDGYAGGKKNHEITKGVESYHIDTQDGLNILAAVIRSEAESGGEPIL